MCLFKTKEPPKPIHSADFEALQKQITELSSKVILLAAEMRGFELEMNDITKKIIKYSRTKTPEDSSGESSGLPPPPKYLNTLNPFG